ncbi:MAG: hypothetical protein V1823_01525 [Chloroflexota bacterium]
MPVKKKVEPKLPDLATFIASVNKKSHANGKKVRFGFTKRKRQG